MTPKKQTLVVMAAGMGSRYGGLKQVEPIGPHGEIALDYAVYDALRAGFGKIVFVIRRELQDAFREQIGRRIETRVETEYVCQELNDLPNGFVVPAGREKPWGTGHAVLCCADVVKEPFGVINADDFYGPSSYAALAEFLRQVPDDGLHSQLPFSFCLIAFELGKTLSPHGAVARGVCEADAEGLLKKIQERTKVIMRDGRIVDESCEVPEVLDSSTLVSTNLWGFGPGLFSHLREAFTAFLSQRGDEAKSEFYLPEAIGGMIRNGLARVRVLRTGEQWFGMTYRADRPFVERKIRELVEQGTYPEMLWGE